MKKEELEKQGWIKQTTYDEPGCSECMNAQPDRYKTIYTREKNQS